MKKELIPSMAGQEANLHDGLKSEGLGSLHQVVTEHDRMARLDSSTAAQDLRRQARARLITEDVTRRLAADGPVRARERTGCNPYDLLRLKQDRHRHALLGFEMIGKSS